MNDFSQVIESTLFTIEKLVVSAILLPVVVVVLYLHQFVNVLPNSQTNGCDPLTFHFSALPWSDLPLVDLQDHYFPMARYLLNNQ